MDARHTIRRMLTEAPEMGPRIQVGDAWVLTAGVAIIVADENMANQIHADLQVMARDPSRHNVDYVFDPHYANDEWTVDVFVHAESLEDARRTVIRMMKKYT